jgi:hypothetical protein
VPTNLSWLALLFVVVLVWLVGTWHHRHYAQGHSAILITAVPRLLKPRTPDDCPACRQQHTTALAPAPARPPIRPWREVKSRRGAMGRIDTQGFACPNRMCIYHQITDAQIHAPLW